GTRLGLNWTSAINAAAMRSLSARGSSSMPMVVIWPRRRARYPSMPSVMDAAMNSADASSSCSPSNAREWLVESSQISSGMLQMRVSVMELGRFTAGTGRQRSGQSWQRLIILYPEEGINEAKGQWESRGDSRPRLSAEQSSAGSGSVKSVELRSTGQPRAAVPTWFLAYESLPVLPSPRFLSMPMPSSSIEE